MTIEQIKQLSKEIHEGNAKRGFWDEPRKMSEVLVLIRTEIDEAVEAHREGRNADVVKYKEAQNISDEINIEFDIETCITFNTVLFKTLIKDTVEDELADTVIRILDLPTSGMISYSLFYGFLNHLRAFYNKEYDCESFTDLVDEFHYIMPNRKCDMETICIGLVKSLLLVIHYCSIIDINIWWHVKEKLKYNATRPYKHDKKY